jgi:hypothetical protein
MPEQLSDQQTRSAFAELRAGELGRLSPPGTAAARHTLRRRRRATAAAVGLAVLGTAGGIQMVRAVGDADAGRPTPPVAGPATTVTTGPPATVGESLRRARIAQQAVSVDPEAKRLMGSIGTLQSGRFDRNSRGIDPGRYVIRVACVGSGSMTVAVRVAPAEKIFDAGDLVRGRITCTAQPDQTPLAFDVPAPGELAIEMTPDSATDGATGFAYQISRQ